MLSPMAKGLDDLRSFAVVRRNETIFKGSASRFDDLEKIVVTSRAQRDDVLAVFERHGVTEIGGRPVGEVVQVGGG